MRNIFARWFKKKSKNKEVSLSYIFVEELPKTIKKRKVYVLTNGGYPWQLNFTCPCGCQVLLHINLLQEMSPYWTYEIDIKKRMSLRPSIHRKVGCQSHFFLTNGKIRWV
ncbi:MAG: DUF6527 family protein [Chitinophagaceae bacterium]